MKIIKLSETERNENSENCVCQEYDFGSPDIDLGVCKITGRYPNDGYVYNEKSKEMVFVLSGSGTLYINNEKISFTKDDAILIEPLEKYYFDANCIVALICNPAWQKENHKWIRSE